MDPSNQENDGKKDTNSFAIKDTKTIRDKSNYIKQLIPAGATALFLLVVWGLLTVSDIRMNRQSQTDNNSEIAEITDGAPDERAIQEEEKARDEAIRTDFMNIKKQIEQASESEELFPLYIFAVTIGVEVEASETQDYAAKALAIFEQDASGEFTDFYKDYRPALELISQGNFAEGKQALPSYRQE